MRDALGGPQPRKSYLLYTCITVCLAPAYQSETQSVEKHHHHHRHRSCESCAKPPTDPIRTTVLSQYMQFPSVGMLVAYQLQRSR